MNEFTQYDLNNQLIESLNNNNFINPTEIQAESLPLILEGKDILAQAKTGSGKTGAFVIPILERILFKYPNDIESLSYIVLAPTRELAQQTYKVSKLFGEHLGLKCACFIGGEDIKKQKTSLEKGLNLIIATPGRLIDLYKQKLVSFSNVKGIVLDEADRLFDMGFKEDILYLIKKTPENRQLLMFTATNNLDVLNTAYRFNSHPVEIKVSTKDDIVVNSINQSLYHVGQNEKVPLLVNLLREMSNAYGLIFCNTISEVHTLKQWLDNQDLPHSIKAISGNLAQNKRTKLMEEFRNKKVNILISTDVAARGLDIDNVNLVVNYDLPQDAANYVHRIGRTGRAGKAGRAVSFCSYEDCVYLDAIEKYINDKVPVEKIADEMINIDVGPRPQIEKKRNIDMEKNSRQSKERRTNSSQKRENNHHGKFKKNNRHEKRTNYKSDSSRHHNKNKSERSEKGNRFHKNEGRNQKRARTFVVKSKDFNEASTTAMEKLGLKEKSLLGYKIIEEGKRPILGLFGKKEITYRFFIDPKYDEICRTYLDYIIKLLKLQVSYAMNKEDGRLIIDFAGSDDEILMKNDFEVLQSFEHLLKKHIGKSLKLSAEVSLQLTCNGYSSDKEKDIIKLAEETSKKVMKTEKAVLLNSMSPRDRRIVHQTLNKNPKIKTKSVGEGHYKRIEVSLA